MGPGGGHARARLTREVPSVGQGPNNLVRRPEDTAQRGQVYVLTLSPTPAPPSCSLTPSRLEASCPTVSLGAKGTRAATAFCAQQPQSTHAPNPPPRA